MPNSNATQGNGPYNGGTLSGGNVPNGGCISVNYGYDQLTPGNLDWHWTDNGIQVGVQHQDGQRWHFTVSNVHNGFGDVTLTMQNTSNSGCSTIPISKPEPSPKIPLQMFSSVSIRVKFRRPPTSTRDRRISSIPTGQIQGHQFLRRIHRLEP